MSSDDSRLSSCVYISNFPKKTTKQDLQSLLSTYGQVTYLQLVYKPDCVFAFGEFADARDAAYAVKELNQKLIYGMNLKIQFRNKKQRSKEQINRNEYDRNLQSPKSIVETNSNIPMARNTQKSILKEQRDQRYQIRSKFQKQSDYSNLSKSRSRSRSRSRDKKSSFESRYTTQKSSSCRYSRYEQQRRPAESKNDRYRYEKQQKNDRYEKYERRYFEQDMESEIKKMMGMMKYLNRNLQILEQKVDNFMYNQRRQQKYYRSQN